MATQGGISYLVSELLEGETLRTGSGAAPYRCAKRLTMKRKWLMAWLQRTIRDIAT